MYFIILVVVKMYRFIYMYIIITTVIDVANFKELACGVDNSSTTVVYEGVASVETYPWMGILIYPTPKKRLTTSVVLITKELVIAAAIDIDKLPKDDFRARSKVILGHNCSGPLIPVKDYVYHPDYNRNTFSAIALVQLDSESVQSLRPICPPPKEFDKTKMYAMVSSGDCKKPLVRIYEMNYVDPEECRGFYRRAGLDLESMWPTHTACAQAQSGGTCVWKHGVVLVAKMLGRWRLLGFGVHGPGCEAPARFLDYGMYRQWVLLKLARIGRPAVTRIAKDHIVLRRTLSTVQRFGPCDREEIKTELYVDGDVVMPKPENLLRRIRYNVTIAANVEYSCMVLRVWHDHKLGDELPQIRLRRWCTSDQPMCYDFSFIQIDLYVEIYFTNEICFKLSAYGREVKILNQKKIIAYTNLARTYPPIGK